jgi:23S rRNA (guanosine2251-2'-O)-methyltransferase
MPIRTIIYGLHAVESALRNDAANVQSIRVSARRRDSRVTNLKKLAQSVGVPLEEVSEESLQSWVPVARHQGVVAEYLSPPVGKEEDIAAILARCESLPLLVVLDGVEDPHNLGACLRTAAAVGADAVIAPKDRAVGMTPVVRKVAAGAAETIPFLQVTNLTRTLRRLKEHQIWVVGADPGSHSSLFEAPLDGPLALVLGSEGRGMRRLTREACDLLVKLPMHGQIQSLNVAVATGVILFEALRQRRAGEGGSSDTFCCRN